MQGLTATVAEMMERWVDSRWFLGRRLMTGWCGKKQRQLQGSLKMQVMALSEMGR